GLAAHNGHLDPEDLNKLQAELSARIRRPATDDDLYSHLMYPEVFANFEKIRQDYSDLSVLPTPAFFYGLQKPQQNSVPIETGKTLIIRLINDSDDEKEGRRTFTVELNAMTRQTFNADKHLAPKAKLRPKDDLKDPMQHPAPIPGLIASIAVSIQHKV